MQLLLAKGADPNALTGVSTVKMRFEVNFKSGDYQVPSKPPLLLAAESGDATVRAASWWMPERNRSSDA